MIFMFLFSNHLRSTFRTSPVNAALSNHVRFFMSTTWADTVAGRLGAGFIAAALTAASSAATLAAFATKISLDHIFISLFC
jgi:hypothetical protein